VLRDFTEISNTRVYNLANLSNISKNMAVSRPVITLYALLGFHKM